MPGKRTVPEQGTVEVKKEEMKVVKKKLVLNPVKHVKKYVSNRVETAKKRKEDLKNKELMQQLTMLYQLFQGVMQRLGNRHAKKQWLRDFIDNRGMMQKKLFYELINNVPGNPGYWINITDIKFDTKKVTNILKDKKVDDATIDILVKALTEVQTVKLLKNPLETK